jgi:hypothetical protein
MIVSISYADDTYRKTQKLHDRLARKWGADKTIAYGPADIDPVFREKNKSIFQYKRGAGYWLWKPYIIKDSLDKMEEGDYLIYSDAGSAFIRPISYLIDAMKKEQTDVMCFEIGAKERCWSKRDALLLLEADKEEYLDRGQICGTYLILRKTKDSCILVDDYLKYAQDRRIITDEPNVLGVPNYPEFIENRHDQTIWSLLCKKRGIKPFRDPSEFGLDKSDFPEEVLQRSNYQQTIESHRNPAIHYAFQLKSCNKWYRVPARKLYAWYGKVITKLGEIRRGLVNYLSAH